MTNSSPDQKMHANSYAALTHAQPTDRDGVRTQATRDHAEIRRWATAHGAEPATGEATKSGPAKVAVNDGGVGIRFNFPGFAPFRPIEWAEWLDHFDQHELLFVFEEHDMAPVAARAYQLFVERGGEHGRDREDWFHAECEAQGRSTTAVSQPLRYEVVVASSQGRRRPPGIVTTHSTSAHVAVASDPACWIRRQHIGADGGAYWRTPFRRVVQYTPDRALWETSLDRRVTGDRASR